MSRPPGHVRNVYAQVVFLLYEIKVENVIMLKTYTESTAYNLFKNFIHRKDGNTNEHVKS